MVRPARPSRRVWLALLVVLALAGCDGASDQLAGGAAQSGEETGTPIRFPIPNEPPTLAYAEANDIVAMSIDELIGCRLVVWSNDLETLPEIAESWSFSEDRTELTLRLKEGVRWHDGEPVTADDVVHTFDVLSDPENASASFAEGFEMIESVRVIDPLTVVVRYEDVYAGAVSTWTAPLIPEHRSADDPEPVGCGPWRLGDWQRGQRIVLEANQEYPTGPPPTPRLELEILEDYSTRFAALRAGRVDMAGLLPSHWTALQDIDGWRERWNVTPYRVLFFWYIAWRMDGSNPFFDSTEVRLAMTHAIDRQGYLNSLFDGEGRIATTSFHPDGWAYDESLEPWPHDPDRARALLEQAGWADRDGDGVRERRERDFRFTLTFPQTSAETEKIATLVQADLREVGVECELEPLEWAVFLERIRDGRFASMMSGWRLGAQPDPHQLWHSSQIGGGPNYAALSDPRIDEWIEQARRTIDRDARRELYHLIQQRLHALQPDTFFFYPTSRLAFDRRIEGVEVGPLGPLRGWPGPYAWHREPAPDRED
jgi:peptide/nickel transport system substrate-binding protein